MAECRHCQFSEGMPTTDDQPRLWCKLREIEAEEPCVGYQREPGTEGDDE